MQRITDKQLYSLVERLNNLTGNPLDPYGTTSEGETRANLGNFHLSFAYGGVALMQMVNDGGGCSMPIMSGHLTKRECFDQIYAFIKGIEYVRQ